MTLRLLFLTFILSSFQAYGTVTVVPSTALTNTSSNFIVNEGAFTIFGGLAGLPTNGDGDGGCANSDNTSTCNNCVNTLEDCNTKRIYPSLVLAISFTFTESITNGTPYLRNGEVNIHNTSSVTYSTGDTATVEATWANICGASSDSSTSCTISSTATEISITLNLGIELPNTETKDEAQITIRLVQPPANIDPTCENPDASFNVGIEKYTAFPGDEKIHFPISSEVVSDPLTYCNAPASGNNTLVDRLVVFYSTESMQDVTMVSENQDIIVSGVVPDAEVEDPFIESLTNEIPYFTRIAYGDQAGNIYALTPDERMDRLNGICSTLTNQNSNADFVQCPYSTIPLDVIGLLQDDVSCFVVTATFGSPLEPAVIDFRKFRSQFLLNHSIGRFLNKKYNLYGPVAAKFIREEPWLKSMSRAILYPVWGFVSLCLKYGMTFGLALLLLVLSVLFMGTRFFLKHQRNSK